MNDHPNSNLIRLYCDGELTPEQAAELQRCLDAHPEMRELLAQQMEVTRRLRDCIKTAMQAKCPQALCNCVRQAIADTKAAPASAIEKATSQNSPRPRRSVLARVFSEQHRANVFAVAATLALVAGAVLFGIFGRPIDEVAPGGSADLVAEAALFASKEHDRCVSNKPVGVPELIDHSANEAQADLSHWLSVPLKVFDLTDLGYQFVSAGHCSMPWNEPSGHLLYKSLKPVQRAPMVSVFISPNRGQCGEACRGRKNWSPAEGGSQCKHKVLYSSDRRVVYFLVCCNESDLDAVAQKITRELNPTAGP